MPWLKSFVRWLLDPSPSVDRRLSRVELNDAGFHLVGDDGTIAIRWDSVARVATYKHDNFSIDEIILAFETPVYDRPIEVSEDCPGFDGLFGPLVSVLGVTPDWYQVVMKPAFAENYRIIYERSRQPGPAA